MVQLKFFWNFMKNAKKIVFFLTIIVVGGVAFIQYFQLTNFNWEQETFPMLYTALIQISLLFFILQPTRLLSKSLIDNILFNYLEYQSNSGNLLIEISDHLIQFLILEGFVKERVLPKVNLFKRDFRNFSEREFKEAVNNMNWDLICDM